MSFQKVPQIIPNSIEMARRLAITANGSVSGKMNVTGTITLVANQATTTITLSRDQVTPTTTIQLYPRTANASAEQGNGTIYTSSISPANPHATIPVNNATITITHANNVQTDRTYDYLLLG